MRTAFIAALTLAPAACLWSQTPPAATPTFEVASIKPASLPTPAQVLSGQIHVGMKIDAARVDIGTLALAELIRIAYRVKSYQITGPSWMATERFDIAAKLPEGASTEQVPEMLQALLAERFKLQIHREKKDQSVYALVVAKGGPKLKPAEPEIPGAAPAVQDNTVSISGRPDGGRGMMVSGGRGGPMRMSMNGTSMHLEASKITLADFCEMLTRFLDHPAIDMTGIEGNYQVAVDLSMEDLRNIAARAGVAVPAAPGGEGSRPAEAASDPSSGGSIFAAVQALGLKLEPRKAPVDMIVVDHLEKTPTEN
ncbi:MAG TPA: TIGR03435 family protein [Bryobacteraceae bacterium]|jgi:uncharacterized protein (TIGR03435 family)